MVPDCYGPLLPSKPEVLYKYQQVLCLRLKGVDLSKFLGRFFYRVLPVGKIAGGLCVAGRRRSVAGSDGTLPQKADGRRGPPVRPAAAQSAQRFLLLLLLLLLFSLVCIFFCCRLFLGFTGFSRRILLGLKFFIFFFHRFHWRLPVYRVLPGFTGFYWIPTSFMGFYPVILGFTEFHWVLLGFTGFYLVLLDFTGLPGFTGFYRVSLVFSGFYWILMSFMGFYPVLRGFTEFHWVLLGFTGFHRVSLGLNEFLGVLVDFTGFLPSFTEFDWVFLLGQTTAIWSRRTTRWPSKCSSRVCCTSARRVSRTPSPAWPSTTRSSRCRLRST